MLLSTFIIAVVGLLITKLRNIKKKMDMIEILTKVQVKMKREAETRDKKFEEQFIKTQQDFTEQVKGLCTKLDTNTQQINEKMDKGHRELEQKIDTVENKATQALIDFLSKNNNNSRRKNI